MQDLAAAGKKWAQLHEDWVFANQAYRAAVHRDTRKFKECTEGLGPGPTETELLETERLQRAADDARAREDIHLREVFG